MQIDLSNDSPCEENAVVVGNTVTATAPQRHWYIAIVNCNSERSCCDKLRAMGYESYVPTQREERSWHGGKPRTIERIVLSSLVFLYITENERRSVVSLPFINKFMVNRAGVVDKFKRHPIAIVPDEQVQKLKFVLQNSDTPIYLETSPFQVGEHVRVVRGKLRGLDGFISVCNDGNTYIIVNFDLLGCAKIIVNQFDMERI